MPIGEIANKDIQGFPVEHSRVDKVVFPDNYSGDKVISSVPEITSVGGEMKTQGNLHKVMIRQGPSHHYNGDGEDYGKQYKL